MKSTIAISCGTLAAMIITAGCGPKLAQVPLSDEEVRWSESIKAAYPGWKAPQTVAPGVIEADTIPATEVKTTVSGQVVETPEAVEEVVTETQTVEPVSTKEEQTPQATATQSEQQKPKETAMAEPVTYIVQPGDSLSKIAAKFYKNGNKFLAIYKANEKVIPNPNRLKPGMKLVIPAL